MERRSVHLGLAATNKTRIDLLQEMIEDLLQTKAALNAIDQPGKPLVLINSTDMVAGQVFTFDRATLDDVCMDYDRVPVSLAVTASAAFPIAFTPVLLRNDSYLSSGCPGTRNAHLPYRVPLQVPGGAYANLETYRVDRYRQSLRNETVHERGADGDVPPYRTPIYLRLVDGGVADNSGFTAVRRALLARLAVQGKLRRLIVIAVNARGLPDKLDSLTEYTTIPKMAELSAAPLSTAPGKCRLAFQNFTSVLTTDRERLVTQGQVQANFAIYPISIDFDQLPNATAAQRREQQEVKSIATSWTLQPGNVALLDRVAGELLWRHPCFRELVADIGLQGVRSSRCTEHTMSRDNQPAGVAPCAKCDNAP